MSTEQELREQYELNQKKLGLTQSQIEEGLRLGQAKVGLSQQQLPPIPVPIAFDAASFAAQNPAFVS